MPENTTAELAPIVPLRPLYARAPPSLKEKPLSAETVLLLEPDPLLAEILEATLRLHRPGLSTVVTKSSDHAVRLVREREFQLALVEAGQLSARAVEQLLAGLLRHLKSAPILVLAEPTSPALSTLLDYDVVVITKPPDVDHLLRRVDQLLERQRASLLRDIGLASLLQLLEAERKSCRVTVSCRRGEGRLWLEEGRLVHGEAAGMSGVAALFEVLSWSDPVLRIDTDRTPAHSIQRDLSGLLLHFYVEQDHQRRDLARS